MVREEEQQQQVEQARELHSGIERKARAIYLALSNHDEHEISYLARFLEVSKCTNQNSDIFMDSVSVPGVWIKK